MEGFFIPFGTILLAELFDKSQLAILLLASQSKKQKELFFGAAVAFFILTILAVITGGFLENVLPKDWLKLASSLLFIVFGIKTLLEKDDEKEQVRRRGGIFLSTLLIILLSELGDKTQVATIVFAAKFHPLLVFLGSFSALCILALAAIKLGSIIAKTAKKQWVPKIAGVLFILLGVIFFFI